MDLKNIKKLLSIVLAITMLCLAFAVPAAASTPLTAKTDASVEEKISRSFYLFVARLIDLLGKVLNVFIPGRNWTGAIPKKADYDPHTSLMGEESFDRELRPEAKWSAGFADASLLRGIDLNDPTLYLAGSLEAFSGRRPTKILDDQTLNVFALSDGVSGTMVHVVIDGYGFARGDVLKLRERLWDFAREQQIVSINVSVLHQHSCFDTLGLSAPLLPALVKNPFGTLAGSENLSGKNAAFMDNLFNVAVDAVRRAVDDMRKGALYYGSVDIGELIHDKREPITFDPELHRLRFIPDDGSDEIWICETGMHCVGFGAAADVLSSDYPYYLKQYVKQTSGADLVFIEGAELALTTDYSTLSFDENSDVSRLQAMGKALGDKLFSITHERALDPVLNIRQAEVSVPATNQILILAAREGLLDSVVVQDGLSYTLITEIGYLELGNDVGVMLAPGELAPELLYGGVMPAEGTWRGEGWGYPALDSVVGVDTLLCFGLCNDQIGYVIPDNDFRSYLTENEEITAVSSSAASAITEAFMGLTQSLN